ncbi:type IV secretion system protein [Bartonella schoenbuchensis]|uniref:type IV secretion system protein n=1 Tax=Bartonella schoenbuchensis TaxID=165694 RepID=UPI001ABBD412|nr:type IV secretion system protein [Bartonella schoenbuchensis]
MRKILLTIALYAISFGLTPNVLAQMPTFDAAAVAKMIEQLKQGKQQLDQLTSQIDEMKKLYGSLNGATDLSALQELLNSQGNNAALPSDFNHLEQSIGGAGGGGGNAAKWEEKLLYKEPASGAGSKEAVDAFYKKEVEKSQQLHVGQAAIGQAIYEEAAKKKETISKLLEKLKSAQTAAEIQDAQAQLTAIQAMLQAEVLQTQAATMIQQAEKQAQNIRIRQEFNMRHKDYADKS